MLYDIMAKFAATMTKNRPASSSASATNPSKKLTYVEMQKAFAAYLKLCYEQSLVTKLFFFVGCCGMLYSLLHGSSSGVELCMLYSIADNAKKSGRAGGNVYMRNGRIRAMTVPSLVQNSATSLQRTNFGSLSSGWNALTEAQRTSWNNATGFTRSDRFGNTVTISGKTLYIALNRALANVNASAITTAPSPAGVSAPATAALTAAAGTPALSLAFTATPIATGTAFLVMVTPQLSAGISRPNASAYRILRTYPAATASPINILAFYNTLNGTLVAGKKVFVKIIAVNTSTGEQSAGLITSAIIAA